jgi:tripartite motif-containing protein 9/67
MLKLDLLSAAAPNAPSIIPEECSAENNSVTVAWQPPPTSYVEGYVLELDDGSGGEFRVSSVHHDMLNICVVLLFDCLTFILCVSARVCTPVLSKSGCRTARLW